MSTVFERWAEYVTTLWFRERNPIPNKNLVMDVQFSWTSTIDPDLTSQRASNISISCRNLTQWHSLSREEQAKYYEKARQERQLHMQLYPGWSARDNYGYGSKKKKRKKDRSPAELGGIGP